MEKTWNRLRWFRITSHLKSNSSHWRFQNRPTIQWTEFSMVTIFRCSQFCHIIPMLWKYSPSGCCFCWYYRWDWNNFAFGFSISYRLLWSRVSWLMHSNTRTILRSRAAHLSWFLCTFHRGNFEVFEKTRDIAKMLDLVMDCDWRWKGADFKALLQICETHRTVKGMLNIRQIRETIYSWRRGNSSMIYQVDCVEGLGRCEGKWN
jgi:hypothetical protein